MKKFVDENSKGPDISFGTIDVMDEAFWRHIDRRPDVDVLEFLLGELGEAEVSNFSLGIVHEHVGHFKVPVDHIFLSQVLQSLEDIFDYGSGLVLVEVPLLPEPWLQIALVAELGDDVAVAVAGEDLEASEDIGMAEFLEDIDFGEKELFQFFTFEGLQLHNFDGDNLIVKLMLRFIDFREIALA